MKKLMMLFAVALLGMAAQASAMYWQVSSVNNNTNVDPAKWTMARVEVYQNGAGTGNYLQVWDGESWASGVSYVDKTAEGAWFDVSAYSSDSTVYSFVLELVNDELEVQGISQASSYSKLVEDKVIISSFDSIAPGSYTSWNQGFVDIPEPTSGLLLLLGTSLLALRRKQA